MHQIENYFIKTISNFQNILLVLKKEKGDRVQHDIPLRSKPSNDEIFESYVTNPRYDVGDPFLCKCSKCECSG